MKLDSYPEVGSSKHITVGLPIKAIEVDNLRLFPSDKSKFKFKHKIN